MTSPQFTPGDQSVAGSWRVYAKRPGYNPVEVTFVRGKPTGYGTATRSDPFGPQSMTLTFPQITLWDALGSGELGWLGYGTDFDIVWHGDVPAGYPGETYAWEGYAESFDFSTGGGLSVTLKGATYQLDNYLAKPEYLQRPFPYEWAMAHQFARKPDLRLKHLKIEWPTWWTQTFTMPPVGTRRYLVPTGVTPGRYWTGMLTRETGSFDTVLSSYIQTLLASMYTSRGRWTIDLDRNRTPVLRHRDTKTVPDATTLIVDPALPGVEISLSVDWSQSLNVAYGQGKSRSGEAYTGITASADGTRTTYEPLAALRSVHPINDRDGWFDSSRMRKEVNLSLQEGLTFEEAKLVGEDHLRRFVDPGVTGTVTLGIDPKWGTTTMPRMIIKEGMSLHLAGLFGRSHGVLVHITNVSCDMSSGTTTCTVDSKYRDALTVGEVRARGRDALVITRALAGGGLQPAVPDMLLPWNYAAGSGYIPSGPNHNAVTLFKDMPDSVQYPWTEWTTKRPPRSNSWTRCYIKIPRSTDLTHPDNSWAFYGNRDLTAQQRVGIPIRMAQAGQIRALQLAAYDVDGNLLPLRFHFSLYNNRSVNVQGMPSITQADAATAGSRVVGEHYPFFARAWEKYQIDGTQIQTPNAVATESSGLLRGYGTYYIPAGYWPGSPLDAGSAPTGMLVDDSTWDFSTTDNPGSGFSPYTPTELSADAGYYYGMIFCESSAQDVYFVGRMLHVEAGSSA